MGDGEKPISIGEATFIVLLVLPSDILEMVTGPLLFLGPLFIFFDMVVWFGVTVWITMKGVHVPKSLAKWGVANLIELIPIVEIAPIRTINLILLIRKANASAGTSPQGSVEGEEEEEEDEGANDDFELWEEELGVTPPDNESEGGAEENEESLESVS